YNNEISGTSVINAAQDMTSTNRFLVGAYNNPSDNGETYHLNGNISEIIFINSADTAEIALIEKYLRYKYAPPVNLGPDITAEYGFCPQTISAEKPWYVSYLWSTGETTSSITANQPGTYSVTVTDRFGYTSTDSIQLNYPGNLNFNESYTVCLGDSVLFDTGLPSATYDFLWNNGSTEPFLNVTQEGSVYFTVTDSNNCIFQSDTFEVLVDSFKNQISLGPDVQLCEGNSIELTTGAQLVQSYSWSTGSTNPSIVIDSTDTYILNVINSNGCQASDSIFVDIIGKSPNVSFTADSVCLGTETTFINQSQAILPDIITDYFWDFGNGQTDTVENPVYEFLNSGLHQVTLTASTAVGCNAEFSKEIVIYELPQAEFGFLGGCENIAVNFQSLSSAATGDSIVAVNWNFGDSNTASGIEVSNTYVNAGNYNVEIDILTANGCTANFNDSVTVVSPADAQDVANFTGFQPTNNFITTENEVSFEWNTAKNALYYRLQISEVESFSTILIDTLVNTNAIDINLTDNQDYYWRVRAFNICDDFAETPSRKFTLLWLADEVASLSLWLRADDVQLGSGNNVSEWLDLSGNNHNVLQTVSARQPTVVSGSILNNQPTINFNGSQFLDGGNILNIGTDSRTFFVVGNMTSNTGTFFAKSILTGNPNRYALFSLNSQLTMQYRDSGNRDITTPKQNNNFSFFKGVNKRSINTNSFFYNNTLKGTSNIIGSHDMTSPNRFLVGAYNNTTDDGETYHLNGNISEIIFINSTDSTEIALIEKYLQFKYSPPVNLGPDISVDYGFCAQPLSAEKPWFVSYLWSNGDTTSSTSVNSTGVYAVTVTDMFGFTSTDSIKVNFPGQFLEDAFILCQNETFEYDLGIDQGYSFAWSDGSINNNITIDSAGTYFVTVSDTLGCSYTDSVVVVIDSFVTQASLGPDIDLCTGNTLSLESGSSEAVSYLWNNGESGSSIVVFNSGDYWVEVRNANACVARDTINITIIGDAPNVDFITNPACVDEAINLIDLTTVNPPSTLTNWYWDFGDGNTDSVSNPIFAYSQAGTYTIDLTIETSDGCFGSASRTIEVNPKPTASFNAGLSCGGNLLNFNNLSTAPPGGFLTTNNWTFDTLGTSTAFNPSFIFPEGGFYDVSLEVTSNNGCSAEFSREIEVYPSINANFSVENTCIGSPTIFKDITPSFSIVSHQWNFGDAGGISFDSEAQHSYSSAGVYTVSMEVVNALGCRDTVTKNVTILPEPQPSFTPTELCAGIPFEFTDNSNLLGDSIVNSYYIIDGDTISGLHNPSITFEETGNQNITYVIETLNGCRVNLQENIIVNEAPVASFTMSPDFGASPLTVNFSNTSSGGNFYFWDLGTKGAVSNETNPEFTYTEDSVYTIKLIAEDFAGCKDTFSRQLNVAPALLDISIEELQVNQIIQDDGSLDAQMIVRLANLGTREINSFDIYFTLGDGSTVKESWEGTLNSGQVMNYVANASFFISGASSRQYICAEVRNPNGEIDERPENNRACKTLTNLIRIVNPYPNPSSDIVNLDIILPQREQIEVSIFNHQGQIISELFKERGNRGLNSYLINVSSLSSGQYYFQIRHLNENY
ncbi:MAG: PKD domain-containing protein, partial [Chitinophagaceae bacterium]